MDPRRIWSAGASWADGAAPQPPAPATERGLVRRISAEINLCLRMQKLRRRLSSLHLTVFVNLSRSRYCIYDRIAGTCHAVMAAPFESAMGIFRCDGRAGSGDHTCTSVWRLNPTIYPILLTFYRVVLLVYLSWVNSVVYQVPLSYVIPLALGVSTLGVLYQFILTLDAYRIKNNVQLLVQCVFNVCLSVAIVMQYGQIRRAASSLLENYDQFGTPLVKHDRRFWEHVSLALITCIATSCACSAAICAVAFGLSQEFSWTLYEQVSPDRKMRSRYLVYQVYEQYASGLSQTHISIDLSCHSQVHAILPDSFHSCVRSHRCPLRQPGVFNDNGNYTCGFNSRGPRCVLHQDRKLHWHGVYPGEFYSATR